MEGSKKILLFLSKKIELNPLRQNNELYYEIGFKYLSLKI
jgi:hypothetical protein